jgi:hypothetical protein
LIRASTCAAAVPPWVADGAGVGAAELAEAKAADPVGWALPAPVADTDGCGDAEREGDAERAADGDAPVPVGRDGTLTTLGGAAMAMPAGVPAQEAASHPVAAVGLAAARPAAGWDENTLLVR